MSEDNDQSTKTIKKGRRLAHAHVFSSIKENTRMHMHGSRAI
jgi:hypothetical protein